MDEKRRSCPHVPLVASRRADLVVVREVASMWLRPLSPGLGGGWEPVRHRWLRQAPPPLVARQGHLRRPPRPRARPPRPSPSRASAPCWGSSCRLRQHKVACLYVANPGNIRRRGAALGSDASDGPQGLQRRRPKMTPRERREARCGLRQTSALRASLCRNPGPRGPPCPRADARGRTLRRPALAGRRSRVPGRPRQGARDPIGGDPDAPRGEGGRLWRRRTPTRLRTARRDRSSCASRHATSPRSVASARRRPSRATSAGACARTRRTGSTSRPRRANALGRQLNAVDNVRRARRLPVVHDTSSCTVATPAFDATRRPRPRVRHFVSPRRPCERTGAWLLALSREPVGDEPDASAQDPVRAGGTALPAGRPAAIRRLSGDDRMPMAVK